jgi:diguanylate cyclase (GGDEF)-like protein/PAS domain S-box-containing protein
VSGLWTWDPETGVVTWSGSIASLHGLSEPATTYEEHLAAIDPRDRAGVDAAWRRMVSGRSGSQEIYRAVGGAVLSSKARLITVQDRPFVVGSVRTVSPAPSDDHRFSGLFRSFPVGIAMLDQAGVMVEVNDSLCELIGLDREDLVGLPYRSLVHPDEAQNAPEAGPFGEPFPVLRTERRLRRGDGRMIWVLVNTRRFEQDDRAFILSTIEDITARKQSEDELVMLALHDSLTGLPNRRLLLDRLEQALARSRRDGRDVALLFVDLDHLKKVNDGLGHEAGDELLISVAKSLVAAVRDSDTVARLGGDEFVVVAEQVGGPDELEALARRLLDAVQIPLEIGAERLLVTASIGVVAPMSETDRPQDLLKAADAAMYRAKRAGRAQFVVDAGPAVQRARERHSIVTEAVAGLTRDEFVLHYQPIVRMDGSLLGVEALLRWRHPRRGLLLPEDFLSPLLASEVAGPLAIWVTRQALANCVEWGAGSEGEPVPVSVNIDVDALEMPAVIDDTLGTLERLGLAGGSLRLEIVEDELAEPDSIIASTGRLAAAGIRLAVDHFGTGYSSLAYLRRLPISMVKIDRALIATIDDDPADASTVRAVLEACHASGRTTVAEGVETRAQLNLLRQIGCDAIQGAVAGMPAPLELLLPLIRAGRIELAD